MLDVAPDPFDLLADRLEAGLRAYGSWEPQAYQRPPENPWRVWALVGGRGIGKSDAGADDFVRHVRGPACIAGSTPHRLAIIAPTLGDAVESCWKAPAGISVHDPSAQLVTTKGGTIIRWPNGSEAKLFGASGPKDVERLRAGGNRCRAWAEELAAWTYLEEAWDQMQLGLRLGVDPKVIVTSTPKPRKKFVEILKDPGTVRALTEDGRVPTTDDNPYLQRVRRDELYRLFGGTRLGKQELGGEVLEDVPGSYWTWDVVNRLRLPEPAPSLDRIVVAIDPATTAEAESDETGVGAAGALLPATRRYCCDHAEHAEAHRWDLDPDGKPLLARHRHYFVLADETLRGSPNEWATAAIGLYHRLKADRIVAEVNNGGDMVVSTIRNVEREVPVRKITASRGKEVRAEPIAALYEQCLVHHVGHYLELEEQMTAFPIANDHDDRVDWLVYAITDLSTSGVAFSVGAVQHGRGSGKVRDKGGARGYRNPRGD